MARYDVYAIPGEDYLFLDVQADIVDALPTRVVIPLIKPDGMVKPVPKLHPVFVVDDQPYILATHLVSAIPVSVLSRRVASLPDKHDAIIKAIDLLFSGF